MLLLQVARLVNTQLMSRSGGGPPLVCQSLGIETANWATFVMMPFAEFVFGTQNEAFGPEFVSPDARIQLVNPEA
jgi:hypothetical protein